MPLVKYIALLNGGNLFSPINLIKALNQPQMALTLKGIMLALNYPAEDTPNVLHQLAILLKTVEASEEERAICN